MALINCGTLNIAKFAGPKFIAPDLDANDQGEQHYSVQSFLVPPEELALLKPPSKCQNIPQFNGDLEIDVHMLRQLSEAGITIGRQIEMSTVDFILDNTEETNIIQKFAEQINCSDPQKIAIFAQLFQEIKGLVNDVQQKAGNHVTLDPIEFASSIDSSGIECHTQSLSDGDKMRDCSETRLIDMLSGAVMDCIRACATNQHTDSDASNSTLNQHVEGDEVLSPTQMSSSSLYETISRVLIEKLQSFGHDASNEMNNGNSDSGYIAAIGNLLASPIALHAIEDRVVALAIKAMPSSNIDLLKSTINMEIYNDSQILSNLCTILHNDHEDEFIDTIRSLCESEPKIVYDIIEHVRGVADRLIDDSSAVEMLKNSIVSAVQQSTNKIINSNPTSVPFSVKTGEKTNGTSDLETYLTDTMSLAKALGLTDCMQSITNILNGDCNGALDLDPLKSNRSFELLQRVVTMHRLSKCNAERLKSLELLREDPYTARNDSNLCDLLRLSTVSSTAPSQRRSELNDTNAVPISLFYMNNQLLIEDFLMQKQVKTRGVFLICKDKYQAVLPRESSRDVLVGKCAYTMLDENGIRHFEPLHVYSALHVQNKPMLATRFSMYSCDFVNDDDLDMDIDSIMAMRSSILTASAKLKLMKYASRDDSNDGDGDDLVKEIYLPNNRYKTTILPRNGIKSLFSNRFGKQVCSTANAWRK